MSTLMSAVSSLPVHLQYISSPSLTSSSRPSKMKSATVTEPTLDKTRMEAPDSIQSWTKCASRTIESTEFPIIVEESIAKMPGSYRWAMPVSRISTSPDIETWPDIRPESFWEYFSNGNASPTISLSKAMKPPLSALISAYMSNSRWYLYSDAIQRASPPLPSWESEEKSRPKLMPRIDTEMGHPFPVAIIPADSSAPRQTMSL